jgi:hypothetical protein
MRTWITAEVRRRLSYLKGQAAQLTRLITTLDKCVAG